MNIKTVGYLTVAALVVLVIGLGFVIFSKETVHIVSAEDGATHTGEIKKHSPFKKAA